MMQGKEIYITGSESVSQKFGWLSWTIWLLINALGLVMAGFLFHNFPTPFVFPPGTRSLGSFDLAPAVMGFLFGAVPSFPAAWLGWLLFRRHFSLSRWWMAALPLGVGLLHFLSDGFPSAYDLSIAVLASGAVIGWFQWHLLRRDKGLPSWWIAALALGWYFGWVLGSAILEAGNLGALDYPLKHALLGLTTSLGYSILTGVALSRWRGLLK